MSAVVSDVPVLYWLVGMLSSVPLVDVLHCCHRLHDSYSRPLCVSYICCAAREHCGVMSVLCCSYVDCRQSDWSNGMLGTCLCWCGFVTDGVWLMFQPVTNRRLTTVSEAILLLILQAFINNFPSIVFFLCF